MYTAISQKKEDHLLDFLQAFGIPLAETPYELEELRGAIKKHPNPDTTLNQTPNQTPNQTTT